MNEPEQGVWHIRHNGEWIPLVVPAHDVAALHAMSILQGSVITAGPDHPSIRAELSGMGLSADRETHEDGRRRVFIASAWFLLIATFSVIILRSKRCRS